MTALTAQQSFAIGAHVRLKNPGSLPWIGDAVGEVTGRTTATGRVRVTFPTLLYYGRPLFGLFRDEELETVE